MSALFYCSVRCIAHLYTAVNVFVMRLSFKVLCSYIDFHKCNAVVSPKECILQINFIRKRDKRRTAIKVF